MCMSTYVGQMKKDKTFTLYALLKRTFVYVMDLLFKIECLPDYDALLLGNYIETFIFRIIHEESLLVVYIEGGSRKIF